MYPPPEPASSRPQLKSRSQPSASAPSYLGIPRPTIHAQENNAARPSYEKTRTYPALFTDLFDESYLHPPDTIPLDSPYLSPGITTDEHLRNALPSDIIMHTCEWDMLLKEGQDLHERLISKNVDKNVVYTMIKGVPHGWDKAPNPVKPTPGVKEHYLKACNELRRVFEDNTSSAELMDRRRKSVPVVR